MALGTLPAASLCASLEKALGSRTAAATMVIFALYLRFATSLTPYSGEGLAPRFGDYEAQRHWMEITTHLPLSKWYTYDTEYWGLDYPPLTAWHMKLWGHLMNWIDPASVALDSSRGHESAASRVWMRASVIVADALLFLPAAWLAARCVPHGKSTVFFLLAIQPALILVDHGHFQYNGVSLGLFLAAAAFAYKDRLVLASIAFSSSLLYKQMNLYFAPAFFFFFLRRAMDSGHPVRRVCELGAAVVVSFAVAFAPFAVAPGLGPVVARIFPFHRGIFEDKVASVWCAFSPVIRAVMRGSVARQAGLAAGATIAAFTPAAYRIMATKRPSWKAFIIISAICAMSFFLFSFHVHEKSILIPMIPVTLLAVECPELFEFASVFSVFSLFPLLQKEGSGIAYIAHMLILFATQVRWNALQSLLGALKWSFFVGGAALHVAEVFLPPPPSLPYLYPYLNALLSCSAFLVCLAILYAQLWKETSRNKEKRK